MTSSQRTSTWSDLACRPAFISLAGGRCQAKEPIKRNNSLNDTSHCQLMFVVNTVLQRDGCRVVDSGGGLDEHQSKPHRPSTVTRQ